MLYLSITNIKSSNNCNILSEEISSQLTPIPQKFEIKPGFVEIFEESTLTIKGSEEPAEEFPTLIPNANVDYLVLPEWKLSKFMERIKYWLDLRCEELALDFRFLKTEIKKENTNNPTKLGISESIISFIKELVPLKGKRQASYLSISEDSIDIYAWTQLGLYYGLISLTQLLINNKGIPTLPQFEMIDWPEYQVRGLVDDISRGQRPTLENFEMFIRFLSRTKQNFLVLYMEDVVKIEKYPQIGQGRGPLTKEDIHHIENYAKEWFVTIIPGFELLGHMDNMLLNPKLMKYAEFPGAQCFNVSSEETREFVKELIQQVAPLFETKMFAPICDESFDFGIGKSREYVNKMGYGEALAEWYLFLMEEIKKVGKDIVLFAHDILIKDKHVMQTIQKENAVVYYWKYTTQKRYPGITKLKKQGLTVVGGPAVFDWSRHYPYFDYAEKNTLRMAKDGIKRGLIGLVTTKWGDFFNENFRNNIFYGLNVNGQAAWSPLLSDVDQMRTAFIWNFFGSRNKNIIKCMKLLSDQNMDLPRWPNGMMNRFWYDPFVRKMKKKEYKMAERFVSEAQEVLSEVEKLKISKEITVHKSNLDFMAFAAKMARHYGIKILISEGTFHNNQKLILKAADLIGLNKESAELEGYKWLKGNIQELKLEYQELWKRMAIEKGLQYPEQRFNILDWHYQKAIESLENNEKPHAHQLKSHWIWRDGKRDSIDWGNRQYFYFIKKFTPKKQVKKATIQAIANNHLNLAFNGKELGSVFSRFSLSQEPMAKAVQWFDVTDKIVKGEQIIAVEAAHWAYGIGSINLIMHLWYADGTEKDIITDESWNFSENKPKNWPLSPDEDFKIHDWRHAKSQGAPPGAWMGPITEPVWDKDWPSSISFIFGNRNFSETAIRVQAGKNLYRKVYKLFEPLARLFSIDMYILRE